MGQGRSGRAAHGGPVVGRHGAGRHGRALAQAQAVAFAATVLTPPGALWVLVLVVYFAIVGWGFFGLAVSPMLIVGSLVPHLLFAVFLWGLCRLFFRDRSATAHA